MNSKCAGRFSRSSANRRSWSDLPESLALTVRSLGWNTSAGQAHERRAGFSLSPGICLTKLRLKPTSGSVHFQHRMTNRTSVLRASLDWPLRGREPPLICMPQSAHPTKKDRHFGMEINPIALHEYGLRSMSRQAVHPNSVPSNSTSLRCGIPLVAQTQAQESNHEKDKATFVVRTRPVMIPSSTRSDDTIKMSLRTSRAINRERVLPFRNLRRRDQI